MSSKKRVPGFTAERSLYKPSRPYGVTATQEALDARPALYLQMRRATGPYGPIGLPGQDCEGTCPHICIMAAGGSSGPYFDQCMASCASTCTVPSVSAQPW